MGECLTFPLRHGDIGAGERNKGMGKFQFSLTDLFCVTVMAAFIVWSVSAWLKTPEVWEFMGYKSQPVIRSEK